MKYSKQIIEAVIALKQLGLSSRKIAKELGISKSGVNDLIARLDVSPKDKDATKPKILVFDLETSAATVLAFGRNKQFISDDAVITEGGQILTAAWKWLGEDDIYHYANIDEITDKDDSSVCAILWELFEQADAVVAHNALRFDVKVLRTRCLANGYPALPTVKILDTLIMAKKNFRFPTNRLNTLAEYFGFGSKEDTGGISLWKDVQSGNREALDKMITYNIQDVLLLEKVYMAIRSYGHSGSTFSYGHYKTDVEVCPVCGSDSVEPTGRVVSTAVSTFEEVRCGGCGAVHRRRKAINTKQERANIVVPILN